MNIIQLMKDIDLNSKNSLEKKTDTMYFKPQESLFNNILSNKLEADNGKNPVDDSEKVNFTEKPVTIEQSPVKNDTDYNEKNLKKDEDYSEAAANHQTVMENFHTIKPKPELAVSVLSNGTNMAKSLTANFHSSKSANSAGLHQPEKPAEKHQANPIADDWNKVFSKLKQLTENKKASTIQLHDNLQKVDTLVQNKKLTAELAGSLIQQLNKLFDEAQSSDKNTLLRKNSSFNSNEIKSTLTKKENSFSEINKTLNSMVTLGEKEQTSVNRHRERFSDKAGVRSIDSLGRDLHGAKTELTSSINNLLQPESSKSHGEKQENSSTWQQFRFNESLTNSSNATNSKNLTQKYNFDSQLQDIINNAKVNVRDNLNSTFSVRLNPEHLGKMNVVIGMEDGTITGKFLVESAEARDLLLENINTIKQELSASGLSIGEFQVNVRDNNGNNSFTEEGMKKIFRNSEKKRGIIEVDDAPQTIQMKMHNSEIDLVI